MAVNNPLYPDTHPVNWPSEIFRRFIYEGTSICPCYDCVVQDKDTITLWCHSGLQTRVSENRARLGLDNRTVINPISEWKAGVGKYVRLSGP